MKRLDWLLVRPNRNGRKRSENIDTIEKRIEALVAESTTRVLTENEVERLSELEMRLDDLTISQCEAVNAPIVRDDSEHEERLFAEFDETDLSEEEFETWAEERANEFDCDRCPFASKYSLYPSNPCEMNAGPLLEILADHPAHTRQLTSVLSPARMLALATFIDDCMQSGNFRAVEGLDVAAYLADTRKFLMQWSSLGFGVSPDVHADASIETPEGTVAVKKTLEPTLLH